MNMIKTLAGAALMVASAGEVVAQSSQMALDFLASRWDEPHTEEYESSSRVASSANWVNIAPTVTEVSMCGGRCFNVTTESHRGFVLYAGERVVGYSTESTLDVTQLPNNITATLRAIVDAAECQPRREWSAVKPNREVAPMLTTKWGQQAPYNGKCPMYKGNRSVTGCTGVALAQVLNYHRGNTPNAFVMEYVDPESGTEISVDYSQATYNWDLIRDTYEDGTYTSAEAEEVAKLVYEAGVACKCEYSDRTTSGKWPLVALDRFFNYKSKPLMRKYLPTQYWMQTLYTDLEEGRPVLYSGVDEGSVSNNQFASHIFVVDGCDASGLVHINWGWDGQGDGYYDISIANPTDVTSGDGYQWKQMMICGIEPRTSADLPYSEGYLGVSGTQIWKGEAVKAIGCCMYGVTSNSYSIENSYDEGAQGIEIGIAIVDEEESVFTSDMSQPLYPNDYRFPGYNKLTRSISTGGIGLQGRYHVKLAYRVVGSDEIRLQDLPMGPWVDIDSNGNITARGYDEYSGELDFSSDMPRVEVLDFKPKTEVYAKTPFYAEVTSRSLSDFPAESKGEAYRYKATLVFTDIDSGKKYESESLTIYQRAYNMLEDQVVVKVNQITNPENEFKIPAGRYTISSESAEVLVADGLTLEVDEALTEPMLGYTLTSYSDRFLAEKSISQDKNLHLEQTIADSRLTSINGVYGESTVNFYLCPAEDTSLRSEILVSTMRVDMLPSSAGRVEIPGLLYPLEGEYIAYMKYMTTDGEMEIFPVLWNHIDPIYGLTDTPQHITITKATGTMPQLEITDLHATLPTRGTDEQIYFTATNAGSTTFEGSIHLSLYQMEEGIWEEYTLDGVNLEAGESRELSIAASTDRDKEYDVYLRCKDQTVSDKVLALREDGSPAHFRLIDGESGVIGVSAESRLKVEVRDGMIMVGGVDGEATLTLIRITGDVASRARGNMIALPSERGIYILRIEGESPRSLKIVI
ncbi:MAG: C10 family peptidase [Lepagella sp.]